jgi:metal-sulfur cluster biosynthetic enzyme
MAEIDKEALKEKITEALRPVQDPEIRIGIVDLGLVYDIEVSDDGEVQIKMTLTTPACPYGEMLLGMAHKAAEQVEGVKKVEVITVWDPPWDPKEMCSDLAKDQLGIW